MTQEMTASTSGNAMCDVAGNCSSGMMPARLLTAMKLNSVAR